MKVKIEETNEIKELEIIDNRTGVNYAQDFIGNKGMLREDFCFNDDDGIYETTESKFTWWTKTLANAEKMEALVEELRDEHADAIAQIFEEHDVVTVDWDENTELAIKALEDIKKGDN